MVLSSFSIYVSLPFRKNLNCLTNDSYDLNAVWKNKKFRSFFPLKDKNLHPSCKIYYGLCSCGEDYVRKTKRNVSVRYDECNKPSIKSKPAADLEKETLTIISLGGYCVMHHQMQEHVSILRRFFIAIMRPSLKEQTDFDTLILFRNGVIMC